MDEINKSEKKKNKKEIKSKKEKDKQYKSEESDTSKEEIENEKNNKNYKNYLYPYFSANNPIKDIKSSKISSLPNTFNGDTSLEKKKSPENSSKSTKTNMRSNSTINDSRSIGFSKKVNNKEFFYDYSCLNEIDTSLLAKKVTTKIFGLLNLGNTCFLNSSLQIILHSPLFVEYFLKDIHKFTPPIVHHLLFFLP